MLIYLLLGAGLYFTYRTSGVQIRYFGQMLRQLGSSRGDAFRLVVLVSVGLGSVLALSAVWTFADVAMALMALVNLTAIVLLGKWAFAALRGYRRQADAGEDPAFVAGAVPGLTAVLQDDIWASKSGLPTSG